MMRDPQTLKDAITIKRVENGYMAAVGGSSIYGSAASTYVFSDPADLIEWLTREIELEAEEE